MVRLSCGTAASPTTADGGPASSTPRDRGTFDPRTAPPSRCGRHEEAPQGCCARCGFAVLTAVPRSCKTGTPLQVESATRGATCDCSPDPVLQSDCTCNTWGGARQVHVPQAHPLVWGLPQSTWPQGNPCFALQADAPKLQMHTLERAISCAAELRLAQEGADLSRLRSAIATWEQHAGIVSGCARQVGRGCDLKAALHRAHRLVAIHNVHRARCVLVVCKPVLVCVCATGARWLV